MFSSFTQWKRQVIESLLSVNIPTVFEMEYVWTKEETFVTLFLLLHNAALLAKKNDCFRYILKGDIYTIKWAIVLRAGFWMSMVYCLIAYFCFARQKLTKILQFPIFGSGCMKLVSFDQNFIDWHICKSQTHLSLLKDKEKLLLILLGKKLDHHQMINFAALGSLRNFLISFSPKQHTISVFILLVYYQ